MSIPTNTGSAALDMAAEFDHIEDEIASARRLVDTRQLPDVSGLLPRIGAVCEALVALPRAEAQPHLETVRRLLALLDGLAERLAENHSALRQQLSDSGNQPEHP